MVPLLKRGGGMLESGKSLSCRQGGESGRARRLPFLQVEVLSATASQANGHDRLLQQFMHSFTNQSFACLIQ